MKAADLARLLFLAMKEEGIEEVTVRILADGKPEIVLYKNAKPPAPPADRNPHLN